MRGVSERIVRYFDNSGDRQILFLSFIISFAGRLVVILLLGQEQNLYEYGGIAQNLVSGNGFSFDAFPPATPIQETCVMPPVYPYLLAVSYFLFGVNSTAIAFIQIVQSIIGAVTVYPLYYLARDSYSKRTAVISVLLFAIYPDFLHWSYLIQQLTFTTFFVVSILYLYRFYDRNPTIPRAIAFGLVAALGLLVDTVIVSILVFLFFWMLLTPIKTKLNHRTSSTRDVKLRVVGFVIAITVCGLIITPWELRCLNVYDGNFVFIKASGFNLWRGNNPNYTDEGIPPWVTINILMDLNMTKEGDIDGALGQSASTYMLTHIPETLVNSILKVGEFWWFPKAFPEESPLLRQILYAPLLVLAIVALIIDHKNLLGILHLLFPLIAFSILYSIFFVLAHHRIPIEPILFILSARGMELTGSRMFRKPVLSVNPS